MTKKSRFYLVVLLMVFCAGTLSAQITTMTPGEYNKVLNDVREIKFYWENEDGSDYVNLKYKMRIYNVTLGKYCYLSSYRIPGNDIYYSYVFDVLNEDSRFKRGDTYRWLVREQWDNTWDNAGPGRTNWTVVGSFIVTDNAIVQ